MHLVTLTFAMSSVPRLVTGMMVQPQLKANCVNPAELFITILVDGRMDGETDGLSQSWWMSLT